MPWFALLHDEVVDYLVEYLKEWFLERIRIEVSVREHWELGGAKFDVTLGRAKILEGRR